MFFITIYFSIFCSYQLFCFLFVFFLVTFFTERTGSYKIFILSLGKILKRPVIFSIPDLIIKTALGEMGTEMLLSSAKVMPQIMEDRGFEFRYPKLEESLAFQLGK